MVLVVVAVAVVVVPGVLVVVVVVVVVVAPVDLNNMALVRSGERDNSRSIDMKKRRSEREICLCRTLFRHSFSGKEAEVA